MTIQVAKTAGFCFGVRNALELVEKRAAEKNGKKKGIPVVQKGTQAKMARGEMVRFAAGNNIRDWRRLKDFCGLGYTYREEYSSEKQLVFVKNKEIRETE